MKILNSSSLLNGNLTLDNNTSLIFKSAGGTTDPTISLTTGNNLQITTPATAGNIQYYAYSTHQFYNNSVEKMRLNSSGALGIGTGSTYPSWSALNTYNANGLLNIKGAGEQNITLQTTDSNATLSKFFTGNTAWGLWNDGSSTKSFVIGGYQTEWLRINADAGGQNPKVFVTEVRASDKISYGTSAGASAYTQYNATTKSIDFIFA